MQKRLSIWILRGALATLNNVKAAFCDKETDSRKMIISGQAFTERKEAGFGVLGMAQHHVSLLNPQ